MLLLRQKLLSSQVSALCLTITDTYTGIIQPDSEDTGLGPFTITGANGCSSANIDAMVAAAGAEPESVSKSYWGTA